MSTNKKMLKDHFTSELREMELDDDDESIIDSIDEDSTSQTNHPQSITTDDESRGYRRRKKAKFTSTKSHRVIEKRRRDRMNHNLEILLDLIPHKKPESQRRIEKTEIIEMAIKYIRTCLSTSGKSFEPINLNRRSTLKIDAYRCGYHNGIYDVFEYARKQLNDDKFLLELIHHAKDLKVQLKNLTVVPERKNELCLAKKSTPNNCDVVSDVNENLCTIADVQTVNERENLSQFSIDEQPNSFQQTKVPIFALHPSGTHYIPMCIDASIVLNAFNNRTKKNPTTINEQLQCHPVSIPVNFDVTSSISDPYELDIQNINVIGTRHQTSVRPH